MSQALKRSVTLSFVPAQNTWSSLMPRLRLSGNVVRTGARLGSMYLYAFGLVGPFGMNGAKAAIRLAFDANLELVLRDPVGEQRLLDGVERMLAQRPPAGDSLEVQEILPRDRGLPALEGVRAIREDRGVHVVAHAVRRHVLRRDLGDVRMLLELVPLEIAPVVDQLLGRGLAELRHVPGVGLGVDHALDLARRLMRRGHPHPPAPGRLPERLVQPPLENRRG